MDRRGVLKLNEFPSVWVEPKESWEEETADLVELPAQTEYFHNIGAFRRPKQRLQARGVHTHRYRLTWRQEPLLRPDLSTVTRTLVGASTRKRGPHVLYVNFARTEKLNFCDDFADFCTDKIQNAELGASAGTFVNIAIHRNRIAGGHRVGFEYQPAPGSRLADLRCELAANGKQVSEVWLYRWAA